DVIAKSASPVVILTVDIVGNGATDGNELRPGNDRQEEPLGDEPGDEIIEANAAFAAQGRVFGVELDNAIEAARHEQFAICQQARITVAPAEGVRKHGTSGAIDDGPRLVSPGQSLCCFGSGGSLA